ncbi:MAG TPA: toprim domain-containing protein [Sphingomicrobium sp.]|nr:toprim domain-containing protein [Sphingomicrobium sp.]
MDGRQSAGRTEEEARALVERLGGRWSAGGGLCRCPAHEDRTPSLSVRPGRTRLLLHCFAGCSAGDVLRALERARLLEPNAPEPNVPASDRHDPRRSAAALRVWSESRPLRGTAAERYLAGRGLCTASPALRFHPRAPHGPRPLTRYRPALIAAVRDDGGLTAIHRTFLDDPPPDSGGQQKCGLGRFGRGAVRLGGSARRLGLAEGIETALSATALFGLPCWATLGTERFGQVSLPQEVEELLLFPDHDAGGRRAEAMAREVFAHVPRIEARYPSRPGDDWNDVLRASVRC